MGFLTAMVERLARAPEEIRAENLQQWASSIEGVTLIANAEERRRCKVAGVIQNVRIDPREGRDSVEATIIDGTGEIVARWLGRHGLAGIRLEMGLIIEGTIGRGADGELVILNPDYVLVPSPEHG